MSDLSRERKWVEAAAKAVYDEVKFHEAEALGHDVQWDPYEDLSEYDKTVWAIAFTKGMTAWDQAIADSTKEVRNDNQPR